MQQSNCVMNDVFVKGKFDSFDTFDIWKDSLSLSLFLYVCGWNVCCDNWKCEYKWFQNDQRNCWNKE